ncbi:DUF927 domain-containing protein [Fundidesulfovibrio agrisoli]|uniref:DUF927 domain-containing protein n=1 Tax=Fundidesulfovibrio agrisoli TaxID=2922717 RepID=UPI001FACCD5E|nr:DUF927 domain-containing protein [Fundidesulfovibrio agrisoli]
MPNETDNCHVPCKIMGCAQTTIPVVDIQVLASEISILSKNQKSFSVTLLNREDLLGNLAMLIGQNEIEFMKIMKAIEADGVAKREITELQGVLRRLAKTMHQGSYVPISKSRIKTIVPSAPVSDTAVMPAGYVLKGDYSIIHESESDDKQRHVSTVPLFISEIKQDESSSVEYVSLCWLKGGRWMSVTVERKMIAKRSMIVDLANKGLPVTSNNCDMIINYLFAYEHENTGNIKRTKVQGQLGWTDRMSGFLWGRTFITDDATSCPMVEFVGREPGDEQFADGFVPGGSHVEWATLANEMLDYPHVAFTFYASMLTPLLPILEVKNFTLELANRSSTGKSIALQFAASAWGQPDLQSNSFVNSWNVSPTWPGRAASLLNGLPMFMDDTKQARVNDQRREAGSFVADTMFLIASGRDRAKGNVNGTDRVPAFRTVLLSTGEYPTFDNNHDGGIRGRTISICGDPFGKADASTKSVVDRVDWTTKEHYGHAGPRLVKFILEHRDQWNVWKQAYRETNAQMTRAEGLTSIEMRLGEYFAAVATAIPIIHAALPELRRDKQVSDLLNEIGSKARQEAVQADTATQSLRSVVDWISANLNLMFTPVLAHQGKQWSAGNYICFCDMDDNESWSFIGLEASALKEHLRRNGFNPNETFRNWKANGWLITDASSKGYQKQVVIPGSSSNNKFNRMNLYCITKESVS